MSKLQTKSRTQVRVYRPDNRLDAGVFSAIAALLGELWSYRSHIMTLFASAFRLSYRGTVLGVVWNFVLPIVPITVYILLVNLRVFPQLEGIEPAIYISFNVTAWYLLTGFISLPIDIVLSRNANAMKTAIPLSAAIASSFADLTFETLVRIVFLSGMIAVLGQWPVSTAPLALLALGAGCTLCLGLGLGLSIVNAIYPDIQRLVSIALRYAIFLSGVIFPISSMPSLQWLEIFNPFNVFIHAARDWVFAGHPSYETPLIVWSAIGFGALLISTRFFYVMEQRLRGLS